MENEKNIEAVKWEERDRGEDRNAAEEKKPILAPGEKIFTLILFLSGIGAVILAVQLWQKVDGPKSSSAAAVPLFVAVVWAVLAFFMLLDNRKEKSPLDRLKTVSEKVKGGIEYVFPPSVRWIVLFCIIYCVLMYFGLSFYIATALFLWGSMTYLMKGGFLKNLLWTAILIAFAVIVFRMIFGVVFP